MKTNELRTRLPDGHNIRANEAQCPDCYGWSVILYDAGYCPHNGCSFETDDVGPRKLRRGADPREVVSETQLDSWAANPINAENDVGWRRAVNMLIAEVRRLRKNAIASAEREASARQDASLPTNTRTCSGSSRSEAVEAERNRAILDEAMLAVKEELGDAVREEGLENVHLADLIRRLGKDANGGAMTTTGEAIAEAAVDLHEVLAEVDGGENCGSIQSRVERVCAEVAAWRLQSKVERVCAEVAAWRHAVEVAASKRRE